MNNKGFGDPVIPIAVSIISVLIFALALLIGKIF